MGRKRSHKQLHASGAFSLVQVFPSQVAVLRMEHLRKELRPMRDLSSATRTSRWLGWQLDPVKCGTTGIC